MTVELELVDILKNKLGDVKARETLQFDGAWDVDTYLEHLALFALGHIETHLNRRITGTGLESVRKFDGNGRRLLYIDDCTELSAVRLDTNDDGSYDTTLTVGTHVLALPENEDVAKTHLEILTSRGAPFSHFPRSRNAVEVTAIFGWPHLPAPVADAALLIAENRFVRDLQNRTGRLMQTGDFEMRVNPGVIITPEVERFLAPWRFITVA